MFQSDANEALLNDAIHDRPDENGASPPIQALQSPIDLDKSQRGKMIDKRPLKKPNGLGIRDDQDDSVDLSSEHPGVKSIRSTAVRHFVA